MNARALDWQEILTAEIRSVQAFHPLAHSALQNWGAWSRELHGVFPRLTHPSMWDQCVSSKFDDWADPKPEDTLVDQVEVKPEAEDRERSDEKLAERVDRLIHDASFPAVWRMILRTAYFRNLPEYQYPQDARTSQASFILFLDGALTHLERSL